MQYFTQLNQHIEAVIWSTSLDMSAIFHSRPDDRFTEIENKVVLFQHTILAKESM